VFILIIITKKMKNTKNLILGTVVAIGTVGVLTMSSALAAETIGTVTGKDGDIKDKVAITAEIVSVDGSQVTFKDIDTNEEYSSSFGPSWFTKSYEAGERVDVVGVTTEEDNNDNHHNFQVMEVDGTALRESFEGKPSWAGQGGNGEGKGEGAGQGRGHGGNGSRQNGSKFVDADNDGVCDNDN